MQFLIAEGRNLNVFLQDERVNCHLVWRQKGGQRLQFCFPEGNCGAGVDLEGSVELVPDLSSWGASDRLRGSQVTLQVVGPLVLGEACLDTLRALRDWTHPEAHEHRKQLRARSGFVEPVWSPGATPQTLELRTRGLAGQWTMVLALEFPKGVVWQSRGAGLALLGPLSTWTLRVRAGHDHPALHPIGEAKLLSANARRALASLGTKEQERIRVARRNLSFLAFEEKLVAGSWRFLTYFGRDSLITSLLLGPTASLDVHRAALGSVVARLSHGGQVAHEEDIGDQAAYRRREISDEQGVVTRSGEPVYDYKMVDDDFLLLTAARAVAAHPEAGTWWEEFRRDHQAAIDANVKWCLARLGKLVALDHDFVGDWRDSHGGLGGGVYPNSVNVGLVPAFLEALAWYRGEAGSDPSSWSSVVPRFRVQLSADQVRSRLTAYLEAVPSQEGRWLRSRPLGEGITIGDWLTENAPFPSLDAGLTFSALSLDRNQVPVEVVHSDLSFRLFLADPEVSELESYLTLLELPFPLGLAHPVGFLVANAALSGRPELWQSLGRQAYHGAVVWSWQDAMISLGLRRQERRADLSPGLHDRIVRLRTQADDQRRTAGALVSSELWTWSIVDGRAVPMAFGTEAGDETESNAIQLWSSAALALALGDRLD